jgi:hypothetical protein
MIFIMVTSPAINAGEIGLSEDFDQNPVPVGNARTWAFEYQGIKQDWEQVRFKRSRQSTDNQFRLMIY